MAQKTANMFGEEYIEDSNFSPGKVSRELTLMEKVKRLFPEYDVMLLQYKVLFYSGPWEPSGFMATQLFMETEPPGRELSVATKLWLPMENVALDL